LPPDSVVQDEDTILADSARLIDRYHQPDAHAMVQVALAPCSPFSVSTSLMRRTVERTWLAHGVHFDGAEIASINRHPTTPRTWCRKSGAPFCCSAAATG
jgi:hypothetical protein